MSTILKSKRLSFTSLDFYENYVISKMDEGTVFDSVLCQQMVDACLEFFNGNSFIYIANRVNHYNVDPMIYLGLGKYTVFKGIAIVDKTSSSINLAAFEKNFTRYPFEIFDNLSDATTWADDLIKKVGL